VSSIDTTSEHRGNSSIPLTNTSASATGSCHNMIAAVPIGTIGVYEEEEEEVPKWMR
jgi:hypothetical protein